MFIYQPTKDHCLFTCWYLSFVHFADDRPERREHDGKFAAMGDVFSRWEATLNSYFVQGERVTIDETLVPFRGRFVIRVADISDTYLHTYMQMPIPTVHAI